MNPSSLTEYEILSRCLDDHCISEMSEMVFICEQVYQFEKGGMGSKARAGVLLRCPVQLLNKFWEEYDSSENFSNAFKVKCASILKDRHEWSNEYQRAYESEKLSAHEGIGPVFECSRVYSFENHHLMFVSAWYDPKMGFSGFFYYKGSTIDDLEFKSKYFCLVS